MMSWRSYPHTDVAEGTTAEGHNDAARCASSRDGDTEHDLARDRRACKQQAARLTPAGDPTIGSAAAESRRFIACMEAKVGDERRYFRAPHAASHDIKARPTSRLRHNVLFHRLF